MPNRIAIVTVVVEAAATEATFSATQLTILRSLLMDLLLSREVV